MKVNIAPNDSSGLSPTVAPLQADPYFSVGTLIRFCNGHNSLQNLIDCGIGSSSMSNAAVNV